MKNLTGQFELTRTVRFSVALHDDAPDRDRAVHNSFAGWPSMRRIGAHFELDVRYRGEADPISGYLLNIAHVDRAVREHAIPMIESSVRSRADCSPEQLLPGILSKLRSALGDGVDSIRWRLTPYYSVSMSTHSADFVLVSQQFEFSAAHRLHVAHWSDERNREFFGKCNNPNGHGHNYRVEVAVTVPIAHDARRLTLPRLEQIVDQILVQRFDHKHLNRDTAEFAELNPSVENIARVCHDLLHDPIKQAGGSLAYVTIWETHKTCCRYPAEIPVD